MKQTALYTHPASLLHNTGEKHPESALRLQTVLSAMEKTFPIQQDKSTPYTWIKDYPKADKATILQAHTQQYWDYIQKTQSKINTQTPTVKLDEDTLLSQGSLDAALFGVGAACQAVDDVIAGKYKNAFCLIRPPGHHALKNISMGFCIFGNAAIAALQALAHPDINKVAIVDFDVHHGNGTEDLIKNNKDILLISTHQGDIWPYEHHAETGPHNTIHNIALAPHLPAQDYHKLFDEKVMPLLDTWKPDIIIISAGFDAHKDDPPKDILFNDAPGRQMLTEEDFNIITTKIARIAHKYSQGRIVSLLEGGYNPSVLARCCIEHTKTLIKS